ncbi:MAG: toll/interleukin-1 receptor domain-containing protein [Thermoleophilia bacterium]
MADNLQTYDIAVSFAGEDRPYVEQVSNLLMRIGLSVFYDGYEKADLWGKDLYAHLTNVYRDNSKYCLMFVSEHYAKKQWTNHERKAAQARAFSENREYILPLRLDDSSVDGILDTTGFVDARSTPVDEIVEMLRTKVLKLNEQSGIKAEIVRAEDAFDKAGIQLPTGQKSPRYDDGDQLPNVRRYATSFRVSNKTERR